ncbi:MULTISPECIES: DNA polymerase III subunit beta [Azospira]|jgi:DNA polymerase-3 subunit beta|uniref:Beta sliding clamp n=2 Tax=Azospira oryzae TaxID=146939 RepID=G8QHT6_AZOOP|nr:MULTISPECIES: DNA polymerase III subunit beta [Azospira]TLS18082.1 MAG: DNA polymerase III subunit beta [Betaproteobacteria bacterium]AEV25237.1 DNA polymerase III, beta subunit [Azospira oryzae PS]MBP7488690.1 DNA polymerase III subunit beta [Azospira sp.]MDK9691235.1 DNA polymerase III subunit beta [Azospira sp.]RZT76415.1 DNA polymerase III beta subunit [Azospira oryzae]
MLLIKTQRDTLLSPLQSVSGIVEKRHTLPILSNVLLEKKGDALTFLATDIEIQITTSAAAEGGEGDGAVTVGARKLQDILRSLPEGTEVSLVLEEKRLLVRGGKSRFTLQTLPADDFPRMAIGNDDAKRFSVTQKQFRQLLAQTQYAMAAQDVRYYLNGLLLLTEGKELRAVATDGHRLAFASMEIEAELPRQELILPRKTVLELNRLLADSDDALEITLSANQVRFAFGNVVLVSKLIDGKFPDYERVIPATLKNSLELGRTALLQSMVRAAILTNEKFRGVRLVLQGNSLKVMAANAEQEEAQEELEVEYAGDSLDVGFNVGYVLDVLNNVSSDTVTLNFNDANSSALITVPGNDRFKYVVMPMRI